MLLTRLITPTTITAIFHGIPGFLPLFAPGKWAPAAQAGLLWQVGFFYGLTPGFHSLSG